MGKKHAEQKTGRISWIEILAIRVQFGRKVDVDRRFTKHGAGFVEVVIILFGVEVFLPRHQTYATLLHCVTEHDQRITGVGVRRTGASPVMVRGRGRSTDAARLFSEIVGEV